MDVTCPWCGARLDEHIPFQADAPAVPVAGTASICLRCAHVGIFDHGPFGLILRMPSESDWADLRDTPGFMEALRAAQAGRWRYEG